MPDRPLPDLAIADDGPDVVIRDQSSTTARRWNWVEPSGRVCEPVGSKIRATCSLAMTSRTKTPPVRRLARTLLRTCRLSVALSKKPKEVKRQTARSKVSVRTKSRMSLSTHSTATSAVSPRCLALSRREPGAIDPGHLEARLSQGDGMATRTAAEVEGPAGAALRQGKEVADVEPRLIQPLGREHEGEVELPEAVVGEPVGHRAVAPRAIGGYPFNRWPLRARGVGSEPRAPLRRRRSRPGSGPSA